MYLRLKLHVTKRVKTFKDLTNSFRLLFVSCNVIDKFILPRDLDYLHELSQRYV